MFITIKRLFEWVILLIFFLMFTIVMYKFTIKFASWIEPNQFKQPHGNSLKVSGVFPDLSNNSVESKEQFFERLKIFYWLGE